MSKPLEQGDDMDDLVASYSNEHEPIFAAVRRAIKGKRSTLARSTAAMDVIMTHPAEACEAAYQYGDQEFRKAIEAFPSRLPQSEHNDRLRVLQLTWVWPLVYLGGTPRYIERRSSTAPADAHWRRYALLDNRAVKARSVKRQLWLVEWEKKYSRSDARKRAEAKYNAKRRAARAAKKASKAV